MSKRVQIRAGDVKKDMYLYSERDDYNMGHIHKVIDIMYFKEEFPGGPLGSVYRPDPPPLDEPNPCDIIIETDCLGVYLIATDVLELCTAEEIRQFEVKIEK